MDEQVGDEGPGVLKREGGVELKDFLDGRMREDRRQQDPDDDIRDREARDYRAQPNRISVHAPLPARPIRSHSSANGMPTAAADCGSRLVAVIPGRALTSRQTGPPCGEEPKT